MPVVTMSPRSQSVPPVVPFPSPMRRAGGPQHGALGPRVMRRGSLEQGRALEVLGHAVEYLVDSRLFVLDQEAVSSDEEAVQIMMRLSRAVFAECPEVVSLRRKVRMWITERLSSEGELEGSR